MKRAAYQAERASQRRGYILVTLAFLLVILIGMLGMVIDAGQLMTAHRQAQNAADAAARACARRVQYEESVNGFAAIESGMAATLQPIADLHGLTYNRNWNTNTTPAGASVVVNHPPASPSPYATDLGTPAGHTAVRFVEAVVTYPVKTFFIQVIGGAKSCQVKARAVAGYKPMSIPDGGLILLDPDGSPGMSLGGTGATVRVSAAIFDYSMHVGENGYGDQVGTIRTGQPAAAQGGGATLVAPAVYVSGGVDNAANFAAPDVGALYAGTLAPVFDPFFNEGSPLPIPSTANGVSNVNYGDANVTNNQTVVLSPGIYSSITISGGDVTFLPGIYVLRPSGGGGNVFTITGGTVRGTGVMFYNTGKTYNPVTGAPDTGDMSVTTDYRPTNADTNSEHFGGISINGPNVTFTAPATGPFKNILLYQRRFNTESITINGGLPAPAGLQGVVYAKWANLKLAGNGTYNFGIVVGTISINGNAAVNVPQGVTMPQQKIQPVFLVE